MKPSLDSMTFVRCLLAGMWMIAGPMSGRVLGHEPDLNEGTVSNSATLTESVHVMEGKGGAPRERRQPREVVQVGGIVEIAEDEEVQDVVVVFGELQARGTVNGDVVVVFGRATIDGEVRGDVVMPFSRLELGPDARLSGDLIVVLGGLHAEPTATIGGQRIDLSMTLLKERLPGLGRMEEWLTQGLLWGRPLPHQAGWWWWVALGSVVFCFLTALIFARPLAASVRALETSPAASFFVGLLLFVLTGPLLLMLVATGVGLIVVPFVVASLLVAFLFGKIAVYQYVGRELGRQIGSTTLRIPLIALLTGVVIFYLAYLIPVVGLLVWLVTGLLGVGGVLIALFGAFRMETGASSGTAATVGAGAESARIAAPAPDPPLMPETRLSTLQHDPSQGMDRSGLTAPPRIPGQVPVTVALDMGSLPRVGFWMRFWATLIDLLLIGVLVGLLERGSWFIPLWGVYHVGMWAWRGTTIGGIVMGLKIARIDGRPVDFPIALVRGLSGFLSALALFLGFFWAGWTREKRAWHDIIAGTMMVKMPKGTSMV